MVKANEESEVGEQWDDTVSSLLHDMEVWTWIIAKSTRAHKFSKFAISRLNRTVMRIYGAPAVFMDIKRSRKSVAGVLVAAVDARIEFQRIGAIDFGEVKVLASALLGECFFSQFEYCEI